MDCQADRHGLDAMKTLILVAGQCMIQFGLEANLGDHLMSISLLRRCQRQLGASGQWTES